MFALIIRTLNSLSRGLERAALAVERWQQRTATAARQVASKAACMSFSRRVRIVRTERIIEAVQPIGEDGQLDKLRAILAAGQATLGHLDAVSDHARLHLDAAAYRLERVHSAFARAQTGQPVVRAIAANRISPIAKAPVQQQSDFARDSVTWIPLAA